MTSVCVLLLLPPPESTLFPYTTLFRSQAKQKQRYREGAHCQHGADLLAKQIGEDEGQEFHEAPTSFLAASTRAPFSRCNVVCARFATSGSWVTIKTVLPYSATKR